MPSASVSISPMMACAITGELASARTESRRWHSRTSLATRRSLESCEICCAALRKAGTGESSASTLGT